jgi:regulator of protease activity HflC (stomatin/prohibitin superfamily)
MPSRMAEQFGRELDAEVDIKVAEAEKKVTIINAEAESGAKVVNAEANKKIKIIEAETDQKTKIIEADVDKTVRITKAEADKQAKILESQGCKEEIENLIKGGASKEEAVSMIMNRQVYPNGIPANATFIVGQNANVMSGAELAVGMNSVKKP